MFLYATAFIGCLFQFNTTDLYTDHQLPIDYVSMPNWMTFDSNLDLLYGVPDRVAILEINFFTCKQLPFGLLVFVMPRGMIRKCSSTHKRYRRNVPGQSVNATVSSDVFNLSTTREAPGTIGNLHVSQVTRSLGTTETPPSVEQTSSSAYLMQSLKVDQQSNPISDQNSTDTVRSMEALSSVESLEATSSAEIELLGTTLFTEIELTTMSSEMESSQTSLSTEVKPSGTTLFTGADTGESTSQTEDRGTTYVQMEILTSDVPTDGQTTATQITDAQTDTPSESQSYTQTVDLQDDVETSEATNEQSTVMMLDTTENPDAVVKQRSTATRSTSTTVERTGSSSGTETSLVTSAVTTSGISSTPSPTAAPTTTALPTSATTTTGTGTTTTASDTTGTTTTATTTAILTTSPTTTEPTTTTATRTISQPPVNSPPVLVTRFPDQDITVGVPFRFPLPVTMFHDPDPADVLTLRLLDDQFQVLPMEYFLQLDDYTLYGILLHHNSTVRQYHVILEASDQQGMKVYDWLSFHVHQPIKLHSHNITLTLDYDYTEFTKPQGYVDRLVDLLTYLAELTHDVDDPLESGSSTISLVSVTAGSLVLTWFDNSIPTNNCALQDIDDVYQRLTNISDMEIARNSNGHTVVYPVLSVQVDLINKCAGEVLPSLVDQVVGEESDRNITVILVATLVSLCLVVLLIACVCWMRRSSRHSDPLQRQQKMLYTNNRPALVLTTDRAEDKTSGEQLPTSATGGRDVLDESVSLVSERPPSYNWAMVNPAYEHDTDDSGDSQGHGSEVAEGHVSSVDEGPIDEVKVISEDVVIDGVKVLPPAYLLPPMYQT